MCLLLLVTAVIFCVFTVGQLCARQYARAFRPEPRVFLQKEQYHIIASTVSMARYGESGKGKQTRFHGGDVKEVFQVGPILRFCQRVWGYKGSEILAPVGELKSEFLRPHSVCRGYPAEKWPD